MDCTRWNETWIAYLYDEIDADERAAADEHLAACAACRESLESLRDARRMLRDGAPVTEAAPNVIVLPAAAPARRGPWSFVGGFVAAAAVWAVGAFFGAWFFSQDPVVLQADGFDPGGLEARADVSEPDPGERRGPAGEPWIQEVRDEYRGLDERLGRIERWLPEEEPQDGLLRLATEDRLETAVGTIYREVDSRRTEDLQWMLQALLAAEQRARQRETTFRQAVEILSAEHNPAVRQR